MNVMKENEIALVHEGILLTVVESRNCCYRENKNETRARKKTLWK